MFPKKIVVPFVALVALSFFKATASAEEEKAKLESEVKISSYIALDLMFLPQTDHNGTKYKKNRANSIIGGMSAAFKLNEALTGRLTLESKYYNPFPGQATKDQSYRLRYPTVIGEGSMRYALGDPSSPWADLEMGYFPYNYNTVNSNFGDYLFKSQIYPGNINTDFDFSVARVTGLRIGNDLAGGLFHHDLFVTTEMKYYPKGDYSLSYIAKINLGNIFELGGGVSLHDVLPSNPKVTTLESEGNTWVEIPVQVWTDSLGVKHTIDRPIAGILGTLPNQVNNDSTLKYLMPEVFNSGDSIYAQVKYQKTVYSFAGTKLMAHASFRPFKFFSGLDNIFQDNDLKFYGEVAVLGLKDYPGLYPDVRKRMPVMYGMTVPDPTLLLVNAGIAKKRWLWDILSLEMEYYANPYPNDYFNVFRTGYPQPGGQATNLNDLIKNNIREDNWKWSVYAKRQIVPGFSIIGQVARDHLRLSDQNDFDYQSVIKHRGDWYYVIRSIANF